MKTLAYDAVYYGRNLPTIHWNLLLHGVTSQKTLFVRVTSLRTSDVLQYMNCIEYRISVSTHAHTCLHKQMKCVILLSCGVSAAI